MVFKKWIYPSDKCINLHNTPLTDPPIEIAKQGNQAILDYWAEQDAKGTTYQNEGRLMILGKGKVGKTSLLKKLRDPDCELDPEEKQTHGINIWRDWSFPVPSQKGQDFIASVWDFGGQDVQHLTHQYFLTPGTVYVVMVNKRDTNRTDEYTDLDYWFRIITALGRYPNQKARVLVVHNRFSTDGTASGVDLGELSERYADSLELSLHTVNLKDEAEEVALLRGKLERALLQLPGVGEPIIKGWPEVRKKLTERRATKRRITYDDYVDICESEKIDNPTGQKLLLGYLARLGEVIHYPGTGMLANHVLLDIEWITKTVYGITENQAFIDREGRFQRDEIISIWEQQGITRSTDHNLMLELLQVNAFELCWQVGRTNFLTPTLFSTKWPEGIEPARADLGLRYSTSYLPDGLIGQLIVRLHSLAENEAWWRGGIYLSDPDTGCRALVRQPVATNQLDITVEGPSPQNYAFLRMVRRELDTVIERSFSRIQFIKSIPCPCGSCKRPDRNQHYFSTDQLEDNRTDGKTDAYCSNGNATPIVMLMEGLRRAVKLNKARFEEQLQRLVSANRLEDATALIVAHYPGPEASLIQQAFNALLGSIIGNLVNPEEEHRLREQIARKLIYFGQQVETVGGRSTISVDSISASLSAIKNQLNAIQTTGEDTNTCG